MTNAVGYVKFQIDEEGQIETELMLPDIRVTALTYSIEVVAIWQKVDLIEPE